MIRLDVNVANRFKAGQLVREDQLDPDLLALLLARGHARRINSSEAALSAAAEVREIGRRAIAIYERFLASLRTALEAEDDSLAGAIGAAGEATAIEAASTLRALADGVVELEQAIDSRAADGVPPAQTNSEGQATATAAAETAGTQGGDANLQDATGGGSPAAGADNTPREDGAAGDAEEASAKPAEPVAPATAPAEPAAAGKGKGSAKAKPKA